MTGKSVQDLLAESRALRNKPEVAISSYSAPILNDWVSLPWNYSVTQFLAAPTEPGKLPVGKTRFQIHVYYGEPIPEESLPNVLIVMHGHNSFQMCSAKTLCHQLGYNLSDDCPEVIKERWNSIYGVEKRPNL